MAHYLHHIILYQSINLFLYILFMKKRTKSSINLHIQERLADREVQLEDLKAKIQKSTPILQTIYDKVKRRQSLYQQKISENKKTIQKGRDLAKQYKKLYEENLLVMKKSQLVDSFHNSPSNYLKTRKYKKNENPDGKSKSVYEQYKQRIEKVKNEDKGERKNPQITNLREESKQLKNKMQKEIEQLKMLRKKSQKSLRKASSVGYFKHKNLEEPASVNRKDRENELKERIANKNRQKLRQN